MSAKAVVSGYDIWCDECGQVDGGFSDLEDARAVARAHNRSTEHLNAKRNRGN